MRKDDLKCPTCGAPCFDGDPDGPPVFVYAATREPGAFNVELRPQDADALLAAAEVALGARLSFGPGIHRNTVEEAARRVEAVADLARRGIQ